MLSYQEQEEKEPKRKELRSFIYWRGSGRPEEGILRQRLKRQPPEHFERAVLVGVRPAVVDEHGGEEGDDVEDHEDGDDPGVLSTTAPRAGPEEWDPPVLERSSGVGEIGV